MGFVFIFGFVAPHNPIRKATSLNNNPAPAATHQIHLSQTFELVQVLRNHQLVPGVKTLCATNENALAPSQTPWRAATHLGLECISCVFAGVEVESFAFIDEAFVCNGDFAAHDWRNVLVSSG